MVTLRAAKLTFRGSAYEPIPPKLHTLEKAE